MDKVKCPEIRFGGFEGDWEELNLGSMTSCFSGGTPTAGIKQFYGGVIPFIRSGEISDDKTELFLTEDGLNNSSAKLVNKGDILYALYGATSGEVSRSKIDGAINQAILAIIPTQVIHPDFLTYWLRKSKLEILNTYLQGGQGNLSAEIVKKLMVDMPIEKEQTAIGNFFQQLDQSIVLQQQKYTKTQNIKKAMLEKMFPKAGSKQPEIRIKGFGGDWEEFKILDFVEKGIIDKPMDGNHGELHPTAADYIKTGIPFIMANDIFGGQLFLNKSKKISYKLSTTLQKGFAVENDVLLTHKATIGETAIVPKLNVPYIVLTPQVTYYRILNHCKLYNYFLNYSFQAPYFIKALSLAVTGATRLYIGITEQRELPLLTTSIEEQTAIGQFFKQLDDTLALQQQQLQTLKNLKQAFLAKMFV